MPQANVEADPLFQLLTDALRAGPGSPEWHQAVGKLRAGGIDGADEYRMLIDAREHLESGKEYRSVRAGTGFTRKLFDGIDREEPAGGSKASGLPTANLIALLSALAILVVLAFVGYRLWTRPTADGAGATIADLENVYFATPVAAATFDQPQVGPGDLPGGWQAVGQLKLDWFRPGLRPASAGGPTTMPVGGGVVTTATVPAAEPFAAEAWLRLGRATDDLIVEFFVSADPSGAAGFSPDRATSADELVWSLQGNSQKVFLDGRQQADRPRPEPPKSAQPRTGNGPTDGVPVRILVNRDVAIVEVNKQRLWSGPHGLSGNPRHVGVRFLRVGGNVRAGDGAVVYGVTVVKK